MYRQIFENNKILFFSGELHLSNNTCTTIVDVEFCGEDTYFYNVAITENDVFVGDVYTRGSFTIRTGKVLHVFRIIPEDSKDMTIRLQGKVVLLDILEKPGKNRLTLELGQDTLTIEDSPIKLDNVVSRERELLISIVETPYLPQDKQATIHVNCNKLEIGKIYLNCNVKIIKPKEATVQIDSTDPYTPILEQAQKVLAKLAPPEELAERLNFNPKIEIVEE